MSKIVLENRLYNSAVALYIFQGVCVFMSVEGQLFKVFLSIITYVILILLLAKIVLSKYSTREFLAIVALLAYGIYTFYATADSSIMFFIGFVVCTKNVDIKSTMRIVCGIFVASICLGLLLYFFGISPDIIKYKNDGTLVHSYGFTNPNSLALLILQPILLWIYFKYDSFRLRDYLGIALSGLLLYMITKSRSALVTILFLLILLPNISVISKKRGIEKILKILVWLPIACAFISFLFTYLYNTGNLLAQLSDTSLSGRLLGQGITVRLYGLQIIPYVDNPVYGSPYTLDNSYVRIGARLGMLTLLIILGLYTVSMMHMYRKKEYGNLLIVSAIAILSIFETSLYRLVINITILLLSEALFTGESTYIHRRRKIVLRQ